MKNIKKIEKGHKEFQKEELKKFYKKMASKGITISEDTDTHKNGEPLANYVFTDGKKTIKMSKHSVLRYTGMCRIMKARKGAKNGEMDYVELTYQMWLDIFIEPSVLEQFGLNK